MAVINTYTIQTAKSELEAMLHGTTLSQINNLSGVFNRAARQLLLDVDPQETKRIAQTNTIYDSVFDYTAPVDLKGNKVIDIRPQVARQLKDVFIQRYGQEFDVMKFFSRQPNFALRFDGENKTLRISASMRNTSTLVNAVDSPTSNGVWAGASGASNLQQDTINFADGAGSLSFDIAAASPVAYIENSTMSAVDLTSYKNTSSLFLWVYLPTGADFASVNLRWGSSAANFWNVTTAVTHQGNAFNNGWNLLRFDWTNATAQTGMPVITAINYSRITFNNIGNAEASVRANGLYDRIGLVFDIEYYSKYLFSSNANVFKETTNSDSDLINLDTDTYNLFLWILAREAAYQQHSKDASFDIAYYEKNYMETKNKYTRQYASELQKPQSAYYQTPERRFTRFLGRNYWG